MVYHTNLTNTHKPYLITGTQGNDSTN
uniref:Uncharacterized protein n=1 Tax=Arundo donax TaxID=35708 RepID=A0A0A9B520_ARUDO